MDFKRTTSLMTMILKLKPPKLREAIGLLSKTDIIFKKILILRVFSTPTESQHRKVRYNQNNDPTPNI